MTSTHTPSSSQLTSVVAQGHAAADGAEHSAADGAEHGAEHGAASADTSPEGETESGATAPATRTDGPPPATAGPGRRHGPGRSASPRTGPPGRRDTRRPGPGPGRSRPSDSALRAAARRDREHQPHQWFARQLQLVLSGQRPVHTLLGHVRGEAFDQLTRLAAETPLRPRGTDRAAQPVLAVGRQQPASGVLEAFARITTGGRTRAMAFRLELCADLRWRCSAFELDGVRTGRARPEQYGRA